MKLPQFVLVALATAVAPAVFAQPAGRTSTDLIASPMSTVPQSTEITSDAVEMWSTDTETRGVFTGNVVVTGTNLKLTSDRLEIIATNIGDKNTTLSNVEKFKYLLATGKVHIMQGDREATCGKAEVFPREEKIVLNENPMVTDHGNNSQAIGDVLELYRGQRRVQGKKVRIILPEIKDLGFDKNAAPPTPDDEKRPTPTPTSAPAPAQQSSPKELEKKSPLLTPR